METPNYLPKYLFVYGTLRQNPPGQIHPFLQSCSRYIGPATLPGRLYAIADYPGAVIPAVLDQSIIHGELYQLSEHQTDLLAILDEYEECTANFPLPHEYQRCQVTVELKPTQPTLAWTYLYNLPVDGLTIITGGDYQQFLTKHSSKP